MVLVLTKGLEKATVIEKKNTWLRLGLAGSPAADRKTLKASYRLFSRIIHHMAHEVKKKRKPREG